MGIGHLWGDFYLQNKKQESDKYKKILRQCLIYGVAVILTTLPVFSADMIKAAVCMSFAHCIIATAKYIILKKKKIRKEYFVFITDQGIHIISICVIAYMMCVWQFSIGNIEIVHSIVSALGWEIEILARWLFAVLFIHRPVNVFIQYFLEEDKPKREESIIKADNKAGRRIGTVERLIMLIFLSMNQYTAIGFVLTAKSIARYDKITKDEKFAEYYLLGTLLSTLSVVICRLLIIR